MDPELRRIEIADEGLLARCRRLVEGPLRPHGLEIVRLEPGAGAFEQTEVAGEMEVALAPEVRLRGGGRIIIEPTWACVAVDVDGEGRAALDVDIEAANELARQVRLRNLGGTIVVDFVDLPTKAMRQRLEDALKRAFRGDPAPLQTYPMSPLGIVQISRARRGRSLEARLGATARLRRQWTRPLAPGRRGAARDRAADADRPAASASLPISPTISPARPRRCGGASAAASRSTVTPGSTGAPSSSTAAEPMADEVGAEKKPVRSRAARSAASRATSAIDPSARGSAATAIFSTGSTAATPCRPSRPRRTRPRPTSTSDRLSATPVGPICGERVRARERAMSTILEQSTAAAAPRGSASRSCPTSSAPGASSASAASRRRSPPFPVWPSMSSGAPSSSIPTCRRRASSGAYRLAKFGSPERAQMLDARVTAAAATEDLAFRLDAIPRTPNTVKAHRLIWLAGREGVQDAVVERLFAPTSSRARTSVTAGAGSPGRRRRASMRPSWRISFPPTVVSRRFGARRRQRCAWASTPCPTFVLDGQPAFEGAVAPAEIAERLRAAAA